MHELSQYKCHYLHFVYICLVKDKLHNQTFSKQSEIESKKCFFWQPHLKDSFLNDIKHTSEEENKSEEQQNLVGRFTSTVFVEQFS